MKRLSEEEECWSQQEVISFITDMVTALIDNDYQYEEVVGSAEVVMKFTLDTGDLAKVIGSGGAIYKSIAAYGRALAHRNGIRYFKILVEEAP